jgi:uncharacterized phiE125 gp8 family phage protein
MASSPSPPAAIVPVEALKTYLRVVGSDEDALLAGAVRSATDLCEAFTRTALIEREVIEIAPAQPCWTRLGQAPVRAILGVSALAPSGDATALSAGDHGIDIDAAGDGWVRIMRSPAGRVQVVYRAGQAPDWNGIAEPLRHGIVRMAAHLYTHRDSEEGRGPPAAVTALWLPYRRLRLR